jgi:dUTP pyrophosphatase
MEVNMRKFEKISFEQFKKDIKNDKSLYDHYLIPKRATENSAGYDFFIMYDVTIKPGEIVKIPTGIKVKLNSDEVLLVIDRSGLGFKYNIRLINQVGVIDADYYNNVNNEGHMYIGIQNEGKEVVTLKKDQAIAQGIIIKYLTCNDKVNKKRTGGFGSTTKEEK